MPRFTLYSAELSLGLLLEFFGGAAHSDAAAACTERRRRKLPQQQQQSVGRLRNDATGGDFNAASSSIEEQRLRDARPSSAPPIAASRFDMRARVKIGVRPNYCA